MFLLEMKMDKPPRVYDFFSSWLPFFRIQYLQGDGYSTETNILLFFFFLVLILLTYCSVFNAESEKTLFLYFN